MELALGLLVIAAFCGVMLGLPLLLGLFPQYVIGTAVLVGLVLLVVRVV